MAKDGDCGGAGAGPGLSAEPFSLRPAVPLHPILAERPQPRQGLAVFRAAARFLAGDDVVELADGEALDLYAPPPGVGEALDAVRREDEVEVERPVLELHEILAALDLSRLLVVEGETELAQGGDDGPAVVRALLDEEVGVLGGV